MIVKIGFGAILCLLLMAALPGSAPAFRCGSGLVLAGDRTGKVLIECGPPTSKEVGGSRRSGGSQRADRSKKERAASDARERHGDSGKVERWFYNCGEHDFVYVLTFEGGVLTREETQGFGKGRSDCQGRR